MKILLKTLRIVCWVALLGFISIFIWMGVLPLVECAKVDYSVAAGCGAAPFFVFLSVIPLVVFGVPVAVGIYFMTKKLRKMRNQASSSSVA